MSLMGTSSTTVGACTILEILPALYNGRSMEEGSGVLGHKRPIMVMLPVLLICLGVSGSPSPSQASPSSFISLPILN